MLEKKMENLLNKIGLKDIIHPIFHNCPIGIRYEIGTGEVYDCNDNLREEYVDNALSRAVTLYKHALPNPNIIMWEVYLQDMQEEEQLLKKFKEKVSSVIPEERVETTVYIDDDTFKKVRFFWELTKNRIRIESLFKEIIMGDLGGFSELVSSVYLFDTESNIMLHLYDDRGMDIVAAKKETILPTYQQFNSWILDYDRKKIDSIF